MIEFATRSGGKYWSPTDLGLNAIDFNATGTVAGNTIDVAGFKKFQVVLSTVVVGTTPDAGTGSLVLDCYALDGTQLSSQRTIATWTIASAAGTYRSVINFGADGVFKSIAEGGTTVGSATLIHPVASNAQLYKFSVGRSTAHNAGTSLTGNVYFSAIP